MKKTKLVALALASVLIATCVFGLSVSALLDDLFPEPVRYEDWTLVELEDGSFQVPPELNYINENGVISFVDDDGNVVMSEAEAISDGGFVASHSELGKVTFKAVRNIAPAPAEECSYGRALCYTVDERLHATEIATVPAEDDITELLLPFVEITVETEADETSSALPEEKATETICFVIWDEDLGMRYARRIAETYMPTPEETETAELETVEE